jgi:uncharacterized membrane-anchored protein
MIVINDHESDNDKDPFLKRKSESRKINFGIPDWLFSQSSSNNTNTSNNNNNTSSYFSPTTSTNFRGNHDEEGDDSTDAPL